MRKVVRRHRHLSMALAVAMAMSGAYGQSFSENFDAGALDPAVWNVGTVGDGSFQLAHGGLELSLGSQAGNGVGFSLKSPTTGDFIVTLDYVLLNWTPDNKARLVLNAFHSDSDQVGMIRLSDTQYDTPYPAQWPAGHVHGEAYMISSSALGLPTNDTQGTLRLERQGNFIHASFKDSSAPEGWTVVGSRLAPAEATLPRLLGLGLFAAPDHATPGIQVRVDNFLLNPVPEPHGGWLLLAGLLALGAARVRARRSAGVGHGG